MLNLFVSLSMFLAASTHAQQPLILPDDTYAAQAHLTGSNQQQIRVLDLKNPKIIFDATTHVQSFNGMVNPFRHFAIVGAPGKPAFIFAHSDLDSLHVAPFGTMNPSFTIPPAFQNVGLAITAMTPYSQDSVLVATKSGQMYVVSGDGTNRKFGKNTNLWKIAQSHGQIIALQMISTNGSVDEFAAVTENGSLVVAQFDAQAGTSRFRADIDLTAAQYRHMSRNLIAGKDAALVMPVHASPNGSGFIGNVLIVEYDTGKTLYKASSPYERIFFDVDFQLLNFVFGKNSFHSMEYSMIETKTGQLQRNYDVLDPSNSAIHPLLMNLGHFGLGTVLHPNSNLWFGLSQNRTNSPQSGQSNAPVPVVAPPQPMKNLLDPSTADEYRDAIEIKAAGLPQLITRSQWAKFLSKSIYNYDINDAKNYLTVKEIETLGFSYLWHDEIKPAPGRENETVKLKDMLDGFSKLFEAAKKAKCAQNSSNLLTKP